jgi:hypothetical protein
MIRLRQIQQHHCSLGGLFLLCPLNGGSLSAPSLTFDCHRFAQWRIDIPLG